MKVENFITEVVRPVLRDEAEPYLWSDNELLFYINTIRDNFTEKCLLIEHIGMYSGTVSVVFSATAKTITRTTGSFLTDGFWIGQEIKTTSINNPGPFTIANVTATVITVEETVINETATSYVLFDSIGAIQITADIHSYSRDSRIIKVKDNEAKLVSQTTPLNILYKLGLSYMHIENSGWEIAETGTPRILLTEEVGRNRYRLWQTPNANDWLIFNCYRKPYKAIPVTLKYDLDRDFDENYQRKMVNGILAEAYGKNDAETYDKAESEKRRLMFEKDMEDINVHQLRATMGNIVLSPGNAFC